MSIHIEGRRWFKGNTYHSVRIFKDGAQIAFLPYSYGYGDQYLQTAYSWLQANGHAPSAKRSATHPGIWLRENSGTYSVIDVQRKKDL